MFGFSNVVIAILAVLFVISGFFNAVSWSLNLAALAVLALIWFVTTHNGFVALINRAKEAWSDIDIQLKRRYDLIPNLVNTVKGYAAHERGALEAVIAARGAAMGAGSLAEREVAENGLGSALKGLFALAEAYPTLKADTSFVQLQKELADTEDKIQAARRFYNTNVRDLNIAVDSFPSNLVAGLFSFGKMELFVIGDEAAKEPVAVSF